MTFNNEIVEAENCVNALGAILRGDCVQLDVIEIVRCLSRTDQPGLRNIRCKSIDWVQRQPGKYGMRFSFLPTDISKLLNLSENETLTPRGRTPRMILGCSDRIA